MNTPVPKKPGMGKALNIVFHQEEKLKNIVEQTASTSHLMNDVRRAIFIHLCAKPCDHVRGSARAVGKTPHTTTWHLNRLCEAGYLDFTFVNSKRAFWPKGILRKSDVETVALLRRPELLRVLVHASKNETITEKELLTKMKAKQQNLNVWLKLMCASKVLKKSGRGKGTTYEIASGFEKVAKDYQAKAKGYSGRLLTILEKDGLLPKKPSVRGSILTVTITLPAGSENIKLECNPFAAVSKILK